ncbi:double-stranded RNA-binding protein 3-like isoform X2 [Diospyros lotus]|nr:double-stranded RNA-binding protein 3-like isoform X2 [Diospyros lotus]
MYKSQLQELAQRSCFNLPSYACIREGPDHAPRFKASVNFNGEIFESPIYCNTLRQAEHAAAEVALNELSTKGPSRSLTARVLDETGVYKNLLQETAHRAGVKLPVYTTVRSGPGHVPVFTSTVEIAGLSFTGESAKTKKQAEKNAAIAAWSALRSKNHLAAASGSLLSELSSKETNNREGEDQVLLVARVLSNNLRPNKDESSRQVRRKGHNNQTRRSVRSRSIASSGSVSYHPAPHPLDIPLFDSASDGDGDDPTQKQKQKHKHTKSFVSLHPPASPSATSKILTPPALMNIPIANDESAAANSSSTIMGCDSIHPLLNTRKLSPSSSAPPPILFDWSIQNNEQTTTHVRSRLLVPPEPTSTTTLPISPSPPVGMRRGVVTYNGIGGGGYSHPERIAQAVQIRSVIPVCAARPTPSRIIIESAASTSTVQHTGGEGAGEDANSSSACSPSNQQSYSTRLCSVFSNKLQL